MFPEEGFEGDDRIGGTHSSGVASGIVARMAAFDKVTAGVKLLSVHSTC
jgi:hypothetical protein